MNKIQLTKNGLDKLRDELINIKNVKKPEAVDRLQKARSMGDLKENSEYQAAREELAFTEGRIQEIEQILSTAEIISNENTRDRVSVGSKVTLNILGAKEIYTIVGEYESDPLSGKISRNSPIAKALMEKSVGSEVIVETPAGRSVYKIISIE